MRAALRTVALIASFWAIPAAAQAPDVSEVIGTWEHSLSSLKIPANSGAFVRGEVNRYDEDGYNVSVGLVDPETDTIATVYVFRTGLESVPVWIDRASTVMLSNPALGSLSDSGLITGNFDAPNKAGVNSGHRVVASLGSGDYISTGVAMFNHDGWLLKVRMSSKTLDHAQLDTALLNLIADLDMADAASSASVFVPIEDCADALSIRKNAKISRPDMMATILLGTVLSAAEEESEKEEKAGDGAVWCRDAASVRQYGIYRPNGDDDTYIIALGDAGISASMMKYNFDELITPSRGYLMSVSDGVTKEIFPPFNRIPKPAQALDVLNKYGPVTSIDIRPGGDGGMQINVTTD